MATFPLLCPTMVRAECYLHLMLAEMLLIFSKPNTAYTAILLCAALLLVVRCSWVGTAIIFGSGMVAAALVLGRVHTSIPQMLKGCSGLPGRLLPRARAKKERIRCPGFAEAADRS